MAERGLFIDIGGEVSSKLLISMEKLKQKMDRLSRSAMKLSTTAKMQGMTSLGRGLDDLSRQANEASDSISKSTESMGDSIERFWTRAGSASTKAVSDITRARGEMQKSFGEVDAAPDLDESKLSNLKLRNDLYQEYIGHLGTSKQSVREARRRSEELSNQVTRLYRAMSESGAVREGQETLEAYADSIDINKVKHLDLQKKLKMTRNGFENLDDEAKDALKLGDDQIEAMNQHFTKLGKNVEDLDSRFGDLNKRFKDLDITSAVDVKGFRSEIGNIRKEVNRLAPQLKQAFGEDYVEDLNRQLDEHDVNLRNSLDSYKSLAKQKKYHQELQKQIAQEYHEADVASQEFHMNNRKQIQAFSDELTDVNDQLANIQDMDTTDFNRLVDRAGRLKGKLRSLEHPIKMEYDADKYDQMERQIYGITEALREEKDIDKRLQREQEKVEAQRAKQIERVETLRKEVDRLSDTDFDAVTPKQLEAKRNSINALSRELEKLQDEMSSEEYDKFAKIINDSDGKVKKLIASQSKYNKAGDKTTGILRRMWQAFDRVSHVLIRQIHLWGILAAVTVGAQAAYAALSVYAMKLASSISESADKLNMSVKNMQELQSAAVVTGTSVKDLREALGSLNTTVVDALKGKKKAADAFEELGIQFSTLVNKGNDTNAMFELVMERLEEVDSSAKKMALAEDIFGEGPASTLLNLVGNVEQARDVMKEFGIVMDQELATTSERVWNKIRALWLVIKRQFIVAAVEASHVVSNFADQLMGAAKQGNIFAGTIVPAVKSTIGILKALYDAGKVVYWVLHRMYEAWNYLLIPIKALLGLGVIKFFQRITVGLQSYIASMQAATTWTGRLKIALTGLLRATGYYLLIEVFIKLVTWMQRASEVAKETELTFREAFRGIIQSAANDTLKALKQAVPILAEVVKDIAIALAQEFKKGWKEGLLSSVGKVNIVGQTAKFIKSLISGEDAKEAAKEAFTGVEIASKETMKTIEEYQNRLKGKFEGWERFEMSGGGAEKSREEMLKTAEVAEGAGKDIVSAVERMAEEGRVEDVEKLVPFARTEIREKIDETKKKIKEFQNYVDKIQGLPEHIGGPVDPEILQSLQQLKVRLKELRNQQESMIDVPFKARMNKFEQELSNSMEKAKLKYKEGSLELLQSKELFLNEWIAKLKNLLDTAEFKGASDQFINKLKNMLLKKQNELSEVESEGIEHRYEIIQKGAERNIQTVKNEMEQRSLELEKHVAEGKMHEENAAAERAKAQEKASKEMLEIRKNEVDKVKDLLGESLAVVKYRYGENSDEVEWFKETIQAKEEADQRHTQARIDRLNKVAQAAEAAFQREKKIADQRRKIATAGMMEEKTRYTVSGGAEVTGQSELESIQKEYDAAKRHHERMKKLHEERLEFAKLTYGEDSDYYKKLQREKVLYQKEANAELKKLEDQRRREEIRENGSFWEKLKLGANNYWDEYKNSAKDATDYTKMLFEEASKSFEKNLSSMIKGTKDFESAWKDMATSILEEMADVLASSITQDFKNLLGGASGKKDSDAGGFWSKAIGTTVSAIGSYFGGGGGTDVTTGTNSVQTGTSAGSTNLFSWGSSTSLGSMSAKGNAFKDGKKLVEHMKGGVVDYPSVFPMAKGQVGTIAEKEPEAVMPLNRDSRGNLGVKADGQQSQPNFEVNVINKTGESASAEKDGPKWDGEKQVMNIVLTAAKTNKNNFADNLAGHINKKKTG